MARYLLQLAAPKCYPVPAWSRFGLASQPALKSTLVLPWLGKRQPRGKGPPLGPSGGLRRTGCQRGGRARSPSEPLFSPPPWVCFRRPPRTQRTPPRERRRKRTRLATEQLPLPPCSTQFTHTRPFSPQKQKQNNLALFVSYDQTTNSLDFPLTTTSSY